MRVAVVSIFRDSMGYLPTYYAQVKTLAQRLAARGWDMRIIAGENDSRDETYESLERNLRWWTGSKLLKIHDGCPHYPSEDIPERWRHIAWVCNQVLDEVDEKDDIVLYVESDLSWDPEDMDRLVQDARLHGAVTAPCYLRQKGGVYYDTWGSPAEGGRFSHRSPYHPAFVAQKHVGMDSCASVLAVSGEIARKTRFTEDECFVGWSKQVKEANDGVLLMATDLAVLHP